MPGRIHRWSGGSGGKRRPRICFDGAKQATRDRQQRRKGGASKRQRTRVDVGGSARSRPQGRDCEAAPEAGRGRGARQSGRDRKGPAGDVRERKRRNVIASARYQPTRVLPVRFWIGYNQEFLLIARVGGYWEVVQR